MSALIGHSGVGKSTLVNKLVPDAHRAVGVVSGVGKGRHTSTQAVALPLPEGGWVVDTPGIRSFGLAHITPGRHRGGVPGHEPTPPRNARPAAATSARRKTRTACWTNWSPPRPGRLASLRRLLSSRAGLDEHPD